MIKISTKGRYGTRLMLQLALNYGNGTMLLTEIAANEDLSVRYLEHIVRDLKKAGLVDSERGAHGGYELAKAPEEINLSQVITALEGPLYPVDCVGDPSICEHSGVCVSHDIWTLVEKKISDTLTGISLADLKQMHLKKNNLIATQIA